MPDPAQTPTLQYEKGCLLLDRQGWTREVSLLVGHLFRRDHMSDRYRAEGMAYGRVVLDLHQHGITCKDEARAFSRRKFTLQKKQARPYQLEALECWAAAGRRGTVVLPTGAGKSYLAMLAIEHAGRDTLVMVPTIELLNQWASELGQAFGMDIGKLGGGEHDLREITVSTYDSAVIHMDEYGNRFGLLIADECHHLPGPSTQWAARKSIAPFRLALTATPERSDGGQALLHEFMGEIVYQQDIQALRGEYLSDYDTQQVVVPLSEEELAAYREARGIFSAFIQQAGIDFSSPDGWAEFLSRCFINEEGRNAYRAYRRQKEILRTSDSKLQAVWNLLQRHQGENVIIFTDDNHTAYKIGTMFMLPVITHHTKAPERRHFLEQFKRKIHPYIVTSKVLNEGVDVPEASVGIVVSGSGSVREHVQRLGRILRKVGGKRAHLYELISKGTGEVFQSKRRRQHSAYQRSAPH